jgi:MFS family permease
VIQRWVSDERRGIALAFADVGSATGIIVWSAVLPIMVASHSWRTGWVSLGVVAFVVAAMNYWLVRSRPSEEDGPQTKAESSYATEPIGVTYRRLLKDINFWVLGLSYLLVAFTILVPYTFISTYAVEILNMPYETATKLIAVIGIAGIAGKLILSSLSDTLGRVRIMILCSACLAVGCLGIAYSKGLFQLILFLVFIGLGYGALWPVYAAAARDFFSEKSAGSVIGLWTVYLGVGSIISPILAGWTIDKTGNYSSAFLLALASAVLSVLLLLPMARATSGRQA